MLCFDLVNYKKFAKDKELNILIPTTNKLEFENKNTKTWIVNSDRKKQMMNYIRSILRDIGDIKLRSRLYNMFNIIDMQYIRAVLPKYIMQKIIYMLGYNNKILRYEFDDFIIENWDAKWNIIYDKYNNVWKNM